MPNQRIRLVYLAGPVDLDPTDNKYRWREQAVQLLAAYNICSYSPAAAFYWVGGSAGAEKLIRINIAALEQSDAVLLHLNERPTVGSLRELQLAVDLRKPVVLWLSDEGYKHYSNSLYLSGFHKSGSLEHAVELLATTDPQKLTVPV